MLKINKYFSTLIISLFSTTVKSQTITMPSGLTELIKMVLEIKTI